MPTFEELTAQRLAQKEKKPSFAELTAQRLSAKKGQPKTYEKGGESWYEDMAEGAVASGLETYYGAKDLLGLLDDEDRARLKDWKDDAGQSGWGTAGQIVGELGMMAIPGGAAGKLLKGASKLKNLAGAAKLLNVTKNVALPAALGAVKLPGEGESRATNAAIETATGLGGLGLGKALSVLGSGVKKSRAAQKLIKAGAKLTPGEAAESGLVKTAETGLELIPTVAKGVEKLQKEGLEDWGRITMQKVNPKGLPKITKSGSAGFRQLKNNFDRGYKEAWEGVEHLPERDARIIVNRIENYPGMHDEKVLMQRLLDDVGDIEYGISPEQLRILDKAIGKTKGKVARNSNLSNYMLKDLDKLRAMVRKSLPEKNLSKLKDLDSSYQDYLAIRNATSNARRSEGMFQPKQLINSLSKVGNETKTAIDADSAAKRMYKLGKNTVDPQNKTFFLSSIQQLSRQLPSPMGAMEAARKLGMGEYGPQKLVNQYSRKALKNARKYGYEGFMNPFYQGAAASEYLDSDY